MKITKLIAIFIFIITAIITIILGSVFIKRWSMPFNSEGNYFDVDSGISYHEQSVLFYGLLTTLFFLLTILSGFYIKRNL